MIQSGIAQLRERLRFSSEDFSFLTDRPGILLAGVFGLMLFILMLFWNVRQAVVRTERNVAGRQTLYTEVSSLAAQVKKAGAGHRQNGSEKQVGQIDSLLSWLEQQVRAAALDDKVSQISPVLGKDTEMFRQRALLKLDAVAMTEAIKFIDLVEKTSGIQIVSGDIRRRNETDGGISLSLELGLL